jgi:uncharacterized protein (TIGR02099 family)
MPNPQFITAGPAAGRNTVTAPARSGGIVAGLVFRLALLFTVVLPVVVVGGYFGLRYLFWTDTAWLRGVITAQIEQRLGLGTSIQELQTFWEGNNPAIRLKGLQVEGSSGERQLGLDGAQVVLSWRSLLAGDIELKSLSLQQLQLVVERQTLSAWRVGGVALDTSKTGDSLALPWLLRQPQLKLEGVVVTFRDLTNKLANSEFTSSQLQLVNQGSRHAINAGSFDWALGDKAKTPVMHGALSAVKWQSVRGNAADWQKWRSDATTKVDNVNLAVLVPLLARLAPNLTDPWIAALSKADQRLIKGQLAAQVAGQFLGAKPLELQATINAPVVTTGRLYFGDLAVALKAKFSDNAGVVLDLQQAQWAMLPNEKAPLSSSLGAISLAEPGRLQLEASELLSGKLALKQIDLALLTAWLQQGMSDPRLPNSPKMLSVWRERLQALNPKGQLLAPSLSWDKKGFVAKAKFDNLSVQAQENTNTVLGLPGVTALDGEFEATQAGGRFSLSTDGGIFEVPRLFEEQKISLGKASAQGGWTVLPDKGVRVNVERLRLENADGVGEVRGSYETGGKAIGKVELTGEIARLSPERLHRYLPLVIHSGVRQWVQTALIGGESRDVNFRVRGDLFDFPFVTPGSGEFVINAQMTNTQLAFAPGWPVVKELSGNLTIDKNTLLVKAKRGRIYDVSLTDVEARIKDFASGVVEVTGSGVGPGQDMIRYLNETPLGPRLDNFTAQTQAKGEAQLNLALTLPVGDLENTRFSGSIGFLNNQIKLDNSLPLFQNVSGKLEFDNNGYGLRDVRTTMLGSPMLVNAQSQADGKFRINANGTLSAQAIARLAPNALTTQLTGQAAYQATVMVERGKASIDLVSDLVGLASALPAPLAKTASQALPLSFQLEPRTNGNKLLGDNLKIKLGSELALLFERDRHANKTAGMPDQLRITKGALGYNIEPSLPDFGMSAAMAIDFLDVDAWRKVLASPVVVPKPDGSLDENGAGFDLVSGFELMPNQLAFSAQRVRAARREFKEIVLGGSREAGNWQFNVSANELNGYVSWLDTGSATRSGTLIGRFSRLDLPKGRREELEQFLDQAEERMPELDIEAEEFTLNGIALGRLDLRARNQGTGQENPNWQIEELLITNPDFALQGAGQWQVGPERSETELRFVLNVTEAGRAIARLGVKDAIRGAPGTLSGKVVWKGSPLAFDEQTLSGQMRVDMQKGQFLKVEPGAAKLIGVLNMQALPRRLFFDFRDLTDEGFAFDGVEGDVTMQKGIATTHRLNMRGVQAQVLISGTASLVDETQKLELEVRPEVNAGGASLVYAALVNPAVGLGSLLAQFVLRKPLQNLFSFTVDVSGSWSRPEVKTRERANGSASNSSNEREAP